jgi:hypothetical protein
MTFSGLANDSFSALLSSPQCPEKCQLEQLGAKILRLVMNFNFVFLPFSI